ncbi:MAG: competence/damage-inducible protein A [Candidatus Adiutrix sp.]
MKKEICCEIITTGSEMMLGRIVDTNSAWLSETLSAVGIKIVQHTSVGDDFLRLSASFKRAWAENTLTVITGGLGPTEDDLTRQAAAQAIDRPLIFHEHLADEIKAIFRTRGYQLTDNNMRQAFIPQDAEIIANPWGTAPGFALEDHGRLMVFLPGVPMEMKGMTKSWLLPKLKKAFPETHGVIKTTIIKTAGYGESLIDELIGDLMRTSTNPKVGLLASPDTVRVVVAATGENEEEANKLSEPMLSELKLRLKGHIFGYGETTLAQAIAAILVEKNMSLTILDAITQGRLCGSLSPNLAPENWGGSQELPWTPSRSAATEILGLYEPALLTNSNSELTPKPKQQAIRLILTAKPTDEKALPGEISLIIESAIQSDHLNQGQLLVRKVTIGGKKERVLSRAAAFSSFHLWQTLAELDG